MRTEGGDRALPQADRATHEPSRAVSAVPVGIPSAVRANWREIDIMDLTDAEVDLMTDEESRWCSDLLVKRFLAKQQADPIIPTDVAQPEPLDIDAGGVAVMASGIRIRIYPFEGHCPDSFAGEIISPTERQTRGNGHVSCLWDRSQVVSLEPAQGIAAGTDETLQAAQPEGQEPGPKDAPNPHRHTTTPADTTS